MIENGDWGWVQSYHIPLYLNTPAGVNKVLNPDKSQRTVAKKTPCECSK